MSVDPMDRAAAARHAWEMEWLDRSIGGLRQAAPDMSAQRVLSRRQQIAVAVVIVLVIGAAFADLFLTLRIMVAGATLLYAGTLVYRLVLVRRGLAGSHLIQVSTLTPSPCLPRICRPTASSFPLTRSRPSLPRSSTRFRG